jgi:hypothetical protein
LCRCENPLKGALLKGVLPSRGLLLKWTPIHGGLRTRRPHLRGPQSKGPSQEGPSQGDYYSRGPSLKAAPTQGGPPLKGGPLKVVSHSRRRFYVGVRTH